MEIGRMKNLVGANRVVVLVVSLHLDNKGDETIKDVDNEEEGDDDKWDKNGQCKHECDASANECKATQHEYNANNEVL